MKHRSSILLFSLALLILSCKESNDKLIKQAILLSKEGRYEKAIEKYTKVLKRNPAIQLAYYNRGLCFISTGDYLSSLNDFNSILKLIRPGDGNFTFKLNPQNGDIIEEAKYQVSYEDAIFGRAQARLYLDSLQSSYDDFQSLIEKGYPKKVICLLFQADIWHDTGDDSTACEFARKARRITNNHDEIADCDSTIIAYCGKNNDR